MLAFSSWIEKVCSLVNSPLRKRFNQYQWWQTFPACMSVCVCVVHVVWLSITYQLAKERKNNWIKDLFSVSGRERERDAVSGECSVILAIGHRRQIISSNSRARCVPVKHLVAAQFAPTHECSECERETLRERRMATTSFYTHVRPLYQQKQQQ